MDKNEIVDFLTCKFMQYLRSCITYNDDLQTWRITKDTDKTKSFFITFKDGSEVKLKVIIK